MLNVRTYLPSLEDHGSLPETLTSDITIDGENSYIAGIPEELIQPAENSTEGNEGDGVINDDNAAMNEAKEEKEETEETGSEETDENQGDSTEDNQGEVDDEVQKDEESESPEEKGDSETEELKDEEEDFADVQYAIESYSKIIVANPVSLQAAAFLEVGLSALEQRRKIETVSVEQFDATPTSRLKVVDVDSYEQRLKRIAESLPIL